MFKKWGWVNGMLGYCYQGIYRVMVSMDCKQQGYQGNAERTIFTRCYRVQQSKIYVINTVYGLSSVIFGGRVPGIKLAQGC